MGNTISVNMDSQKVLNSWEQEKHAPSCDWRSPQNKGARGRGQRGSPKSRRLFGAEGAKDNSNRIYRYKGNFRWSGVKTEKYKQKDGGWSAISRNILVGNHGETCKFHLRYFEIEPNGYSSLEMHKHEHVVVCVRGKGKIRMGKKSYILNHLDTAYVAPNTAHQLTNPYDEPFGFFCIVNAKRDKPKTVTRDAL